MLTILLVIGGISIVSIIINVFLFIALKVQLNNVKKCQDIITEYDQWSDNVTKMVNETYLKIKYIDDKHIFEKDDEVGVVFQDLLNIIKVLNDRINH